MRAHLFGLVLSTVVCCPMSVYAGVISFPDFSDTTGLTFNGSAAGVNTSDGDVLRLTPALASQSGSVFNDVTINATVQYGVSVPHNGSWWDDF